VTILLLVSFVVAVMILVISSRAIVRFMSSLLTIQMIINLGLTSFDYPGNMNFLIRYLKTRF